MAKTNEINIDKKEFDKALHWADRAYVNAQELNSLVAQKEALHYIIELQSIPQQKYMKSYIKIHMPTFEKILKAQAPISKNL